MIHALFRAALGAVLCGFALGAQADPVGAYGAHTPAVAFDPVADRGLVVYESGGRIYGKFVDNLGHSAVGGEFLVFPQLPSSPSKYRDPAIVFKTPQNRFYVVARQSYPSRFNLPSGPVTFDTADGIAVTAFDAAGTRLASRTLYTPGFLRSALVTDAEARPAVAADDYSDTHCCVAVAWEDPRVPDRILLSRLSPDLGLYDGTPQQVASAAERVDTLSAIYERDHDRFAFAYDGCTLSGRNCNGFVTGIAAMGAPSPLHTMLPKPAGAMPDAVGPAIANVPGAHRYVLAWQWRTSSASGTAVANATIGPSGIVMIGTPNFDLATTIPPCPCFTVRPKACVAIVAIGSTPRVMIVAPSGTGIGTAQFLAGYTFDTVTRTVTAGRRFSSDAAYIGRGGAAHSPSGRVVATWQQDVLSGGVDAGVWAAGVTP